MRARLLLGLPLLLGLFALALGRCFSPELPVCAFQCGDPADPPVCPEQYECRPDNLCHLAGSTEACPFPFDLRPGPDLLTDGGGDGPSDGGDGGG